MVRIVDMLPVDLLWLRSLLKFNIALFILLDLKGLPHFILLQLLEFLQDLLLLILGRARKNDLLSYALIVFLKLQFPLTVLLKILFLVQQFLVQLLELPQVLLSLFLPHELLDLADDLADLFLHAVEVLILGEEGDLVGLIRLAHGILQKFREFGPHADLLGQVGDDDGVIRERAGALVVVVAGLGDEIPDVEQHSDVHDEGEDAHQHLRIFQVTVDAGDVDHEAGAVHLPVLAGHAVLIQRPVELQRVVAADRHHQQDDAVLYEHVEERKAEA